MDLVLSVADALVFDKLYNAALPLSALAPRHDLFLTSPTASAWTSLIARLPHPQPLLNLTSPASLTNATLDAAAQSLWPRDYPLRQALSLSIITFIGAHALYFIFAYMSYRLVFNPEMTKHPRFLKNQIRLEIECSLRAFPGMTLLTLPWFQGEVMGYSKLYHNVDEYGWGYLALSVLLYLVFTDYCIYWIHRGLHLPWMYKRLHKPHHRWIIPTPFASHAFHPVDGYLQSIPYHLFIYIFPMHSLVYLGLFVAVNFWTIFIHDSDMITGHALEKVINGPAHHTLHHMYFTVNYGQYFTWADRTYSSYRQPQSDLDPLLEVKALERERAAQAQAAMAEEKKQQ